MTDQTVTGTDFDASEPDPLRFIRRFNNSHPARARLYQDATGAADGVRACRQELAEATVDDIGANVAYESSLAAHPSRKGPLPRQAALAVAAAAVDTYPCFLAAEAFGDNTHTTLFVAGLFLVCLLGAEAALDRFGRHGHRRGVRITGWLLGGFVGALGLLRFYFLLTVSGGWLTSALGAALLTSATAVLVLAGCWALRAAESLEMFRARRALRAARRERVAAEERLQRERRRCERASRAYLSQIRPVLLAEAADGPALAGLERAVWRHLTRTIEDGAA